MRVSLESNPLPSLEVLNWYFRYEDGNLVWINHYRLPTRTRVVGKVAGCRMNTYGYICVGLDGVLYYAHRIIWKMIHGRDPVDQIDHINCNTSDNRIENLREATSQQNARNVGSKSKRLGYPKGVQFSKTSVHRPWLAYIKIRKGERISLGSYATAEEAHAAYVEAAKVHHGEFANPG